MNVKIKIIKNEEVRALISDSRFLNSWKDLAKLNQKNTIHVEPNYVLTWYSIYTSKFDPIFVLNYSETHQLIGLIPLAISKDKKVITHAGFNQSTYHGWLYHGGNEADFLIHTLLRIKKEFNITKWNWGWIPANSNLEWLSSRKLKSVDIYISCVHEDCPVIDLSKDIERIEALKKSKTVRNQLNRFKKRENFHLEKITSKKRLFEIFDVLENQCNFRQMASNNVTPFVDDPLKRSFQIEKLKHLNYNHFTVLWANNKVVAFNLGEKNEDTVIMGIMAYDPLEGKNSPGKIFILKLVELLQQEGIKYFDMTPGGDLYKKNFSHSIQKVTHLTVFFEKSIHTKVERKKRIKERAKQVLKFAGIKSQNFGKNGGRFFYKRSDIMKVSPDKLIKKISTLFYETNRVRFYKFKEEFNSDKNLLQTYKLNNYPDLFLFETENRLEKTALISNAMYQFNRGNSLYSEAKKGVLNYCFWATHKCGIHKLSKLKMKLDIPKNSVILFNFYSRSGFNPNNLIAENIREISLQNSKRKLQTFIKVENESISFEKQLKEIGFTSFKEFSLKRILWFNFKEKSSMNL